jgi:hypothetical protein
MVQSQYKALIFVRELARIQNYLLTENDIKRLHCLLVGTGKYSTSDISDSDLVPPLEIPKAMRELVDFINNKGDNGGDNGGG